LRPLDEKAVQEKMDSIRELGLLHPITVTAYDPSAVPSSEAAKQLSVRYRLRAGLDRLEACRRLHWKEIPALVSSLTGPRAELIEVDENLMQSVLSPAQRATFIARRKALYEIMHPETAKGAAQGEGMKRAAAAKEEPVGPDGKLCREVHEAASFVADTAEKTGRSERAVRLDAERGARIAGEVLQDVAGTPLDTGQILDALKDLPPEKQRARLDDLKRKAAKPKRPPKGKPTPKGPPVERRGEADKALSDKLEPHFKALWQLSSDCYCPDIMNAADAIERALVHKGYLPKPSERQLDPKAYLAGLKPTKAQSVEKVEAVFRGGPDDGKVVTYLHGPADDPAWDAIREARNKPKH
jgi:ParB-like chromosome segregation protein Spo0J